MNSNMGGVVPRNKLQQKFISNTLEHLAPDPFARQQAPCRVLKVFDAETISEEGVPKELSAMIAAHPGWLFAQVQIVNSSIKLILPFREPEDHIYFVYGNRVMLEGRDALVHYVNQDPQNGNISLERNHNNYHMQLSAASQVFDIGAIV